MTFLLCGSHIHRSYVTLAGFVEMEYQQMRVGVYEKLIWTIQNFSKLNTKKLYSKTFVIGGYPWRILLFPNGNNVDFLSIYLEAGSTNLPKGWTRDANFRLSLYNQVNSDMTITKETRHLFNAGENDWGFTSFIPLAELRDPHRGFLVKDTCIIAAEVNVPKSGNENQVVQVAIPTASTTSEDQAGHMEVEAPQPEDKVQCLKSASQVCTEHIAHTDKEMSSDSIRELVDFRGLGQIEKAYIPLLEEVCSQHPSLIECQQKRSRRFIEWAFTALGRVLHFLKTKRVKDMNGDACKDLQILWEELETFRFDLTWLEPHVQSALGMKNYIERAVHVEKLKDIVIALELEMKRLKAKLTATEADLDIARKDLLKAKESFEERDLDANLGYGRP